jgi:hypothetical protein
MNDIALSCSDLPGLNRGIGLQSTRKVAGCGKHRGSNVYEPAAMMSGRCTCPRSRSRRPSRHILVVSQKERERERRAVEGTMDGATGVRLWTALTFIRT